MTSPRLDDDGQPVIHPVAALFPMLTDDELREMADDVAVRGLLYPIVLDEEDRILDGRNRYAACGIAGVGAQFTRYEGNDATGFVLAVNLQRRSLTKGQTAMIGAKARFISKQSERTMAKQTGVSADRIHRASVVLEFAPDEANEVIAGTRTLDEVYVEAQRRKQAREGREAQLEQLRIDDPELAAKVDAGELSLTGAQAELKERREQARRSAIAYNTVIYQPAKALAQLFAGTTTPEAIGARIAEYADSVFEDADPSILDQAARGLKAVAESWRSNA